MAKEKARISGQSIAVLYYWNEPNTDEAARVEASAELICEHLNHWYVSGEYDAHEVCMDRLKVGIHPLADGVQSDVQVNERIEFEAAGLLQLPIPHRNHSSPQEL